MGWPEFEGRSDHVVAAKRHRPILVPGRRSTDMGWFAGVETVSCRCHILIMDDRPREEPAPHPTGPPAVRREPTRPPAPAPKEIGGPKGPEPTRHGDWEYNGRCTDF